MYTHVEFQPGERVTWLYHARGGYGYVVPVPAIVIKAGQKWASIDALKKDGSYVLRRVLVHHLRKGG